MFTSSATVKTVATVLTLSVALVGIPVPAQTAQLSGHVYSASGETPLTGVTVYASQPETGEIYSSEPTTDRGAFNIPEIPAGKFELGVAIDQGLYLIDSPLTLAPAQSQHVNIAVNEKKKDESGATVVPKSAKPRGWSNPVVAALIVVGGAVIIGLIVEAATDDDDDEPSGSAF